VKEKQKEGELLIWIKEKQGKNKRELLISLDASQK
jgi:hypothetical protein